MPANRNSKIRNCGWRSFVFLFAVITFAITHQTSYSAQTFATIEGVVLDATNDQPLAKVQVTLSSTGDSPVASAFTDSQGHFVIQTTQTGRLRVVPILNGYIYSSPGAWVQVSSGKPIQALELKMTRPATISGRVLKSDGQPLIGNTGSVTLQRYTYGTDGKRSLGWVPGITYSGTAGSFQRTDDRGEFRFYNLPPGEYYLTVSGGGGAIGNSNLYFYPGTSDESAAVPIRVKGGDDIRIGTLSLPLRSNGTGVTLHLTNSTGAGGKEIFIGDIVLVLTALKKPGEVVLPSLAQGHYDIVIRSRVGSSALEYAAVPLDVGSIAVEKEVELKPGAAVSGTILLEDADGKRSAAPSFIRCQLLSHYGHHNCLGAQVVPSGYEIDLDGLPADDYVLSVRANDRDVLAEGLDMRGDTNLQIVLGSNGGIAQGTIRDSAGNTLPNSVVALVPDAPYRITGLLYRSVISDPNGNFEIHGIGPGSYKLFAWSELEGAGYRNADFMKEFDDRGTPAKMEKGSKQSIDLTAF